MFTLSAKKHLLHCFEYLESLLQVDDNLQKSYIYKSFRVKGSIAPLIVNQVKPGTFLQFRLSMIESEKATPNQFKVPRVLKKTQAVEFMQQRCISLSS